MINMEICCLKSKTSTHGKVIPLHNTSEVTIGRSPDVTICIPSPMISRKHSILLLGKDGWTIQDNKSLNGTFVNSKKLDPHQKCLLKEGDAVQLGVSESPDKPAQFVWKFYSHLRVKKFKGSKAACNTGSNEVEEVGDPAPGDAAQSSIIADSTNRCLKRLRDENAPSAAAALPETDQPTSSKRLCDVPSPNWSGQQVSAEESKMQEKLRQQEEQLLAMQRQLQAHTTAQEQLQQELKEKEKLMQEKLQEQKPVYVILPPQSSSVTSPGVGQPIVSHCSLPATIQGAVPSNLVQGSNVDTAAMLQAIYQSVVSQGITGAANTVTNANQAAGQSPRPPHSTTEATTGELTDKTTTSMETDAAKSAVSCTVGETADVPSCSGTKNAGKKTKTGTASKPLAAEASSTSSKSPDSALVIDTHTSVTGSMARTSSKSSGRKRKGKSKLSSNSGKKTTSKVSPTTVKKSSRKKKTKKSPDVKIIPIESDDSAHNTFSWCNTSSDKLMSPDSSQDNLDLEIQGLPLIRYILQRITVEGRPSLPANMNKKDAKFKADPRIDKYYQPTIFPKKSSLRSLSASSAQAKADTKSERDPVPCRRSSERNKACLTSTVTKPQRHTTPSSCEVKPLGTWKLSEGAHNYRSTGKVRVGAASSGVARPTLTGGQPSQTHSSGYRSQTNWRASSSASSSYSRDPRGRFQTNGKASSAASNSYGRDPRDRSRTNWRASSAASSSYSRDPRINRDKGTGGRNSETVETRPYVPPPYGGATYTPTRSVALEDSPSSPSTAQSLKDVFKSKDPSASPFS